MVEVIPVQRKSPVLIRSSLACLANIPAINLTSGCVHGCIYCYARGYSTYPGDGKLIVYSNIVEKVKRELTRKKLKPSSVYFSPSTDVFQPIPEVAELGYSLFKYLFSQNIGLSFVTKGKIPEKTMALFLENADKVKAQIGIITPDDNIRRVFEPNAVNVDTRLQQMKVLASAGIEVEARLMPIIPGTTDDSVSVDKLFKLVKNNGVNRVAISTLFLRPSISAAFKQLVSDKTYTLNILNQYNHQTRIAVHANNSTVIPLDRIKRISIYSSIRTIAEKHKLELSICGCMNPDIGGTCNIARTSPFVCLQPNLFDGYETKNDSKVNN